MYVNYKMVSPKVGHLNMKKINYCYATIYIHDVDK